MTAAQQSYTPFFVPQSLLNNRNEQRQSAMFKLPNEVLLPIVRNVEVPHFQVVLGLTCKFFALLLSQHADVMSPWRGFRDKEGLSHLLTRSSHRVNLSGPLNITIPFRPYIPETHRLCYTCFCHMPCSGDFWKAKLSGSEFEMAAECDECKVLMEVEVRNSGERDRDHPCPECCVKGYFPFLEERSWASYYSYLYQYSGTTPRPMHPDMRRRIAKP